MNLKLLKLRYKLFTLSLTGKISQITNKGGGDSKRSTADKILIIFPTEEDVFRVATYTFRNIKNSDTDYIFMVKDNLLSSFKNPKGKVIPFNMQDETQEIPMNPELEEALNDSYKMVIDLNTDFIFAISMIVNSVQSNQKVGFKSTFSDKFYNIQLDIDRSGISERGYSQIKSILIS